MPSFKTGARIRETSQTTGVGTYTLLGAPAGFQPFSVVGANNLCMYGATDGVNWEEGIGTVLTGPNRLERTHVLRSSNADAAVNWAAGTRTLRCGPISDLGIPRTLTKNVAGGAGTTVLTQEEQRRNVLEFIGALTGDRVIEVDATPWGWDGVLNNTTGAFKVTFRVTGQTGIVLQRGRRVLAYCDGTDVRHGENVVQRKAADVASAATVDLNVDGDLVDITGTTGISAITLEEGRQVTARFTGILTLTNGASLVLPGNANITTAAGDSGVFRGYAAGVVRCVFQRAAYAPSTSKQPTRTVLASGSGTYNTPTGATRLYVRMVAGGGGGAGGGAGATSGSNGGNTTFGSSFLTCTGGGGGGPAAVQNPGAGGAASGGDVNLTGGDGGGGSNVANTSGAHGGGSPFGGFGGMSVATATGNTAKANTGSGGGGGGNAGGSSGGGGGAGGYLEKLITSPASSYAYAVGAGGTFGNAGQANGGAGASGIIIIDELYD